MRRAPRDTKITVYVQSSIAEALGARATDEGRSVSALAARILRDALPNDPDAMRPSLAQAERRWLRSIESTLALDDPALPAGFALARLRAARAAYQILVA